MGRNRFVFELKNTYLPLCALFEQTPRAVHLPFKRKTKKNIFLRLTKAVVIMESASMSWCSFSSKSVYI